MVFNKCNANNEGAGVWFTGLETRWDTAPHIKVPRFTFQLPSVLLMHTLGDNRSPQVIGSLNSWLLDSGAAVTMGTGTVN